MCMARATSACFNYMLKITLHCTCVKWVNIHVCMWRQKSIIKQYGQWDLNPHESLRPAKIRRAIFFSEVPYNSKTKWNITISSRKWPRATSPSLTPYYSIAHEDMLCESLRSRTRPRKKPHEEPQKKQGAQNEPQRPRKKNRWRTGSVTWLAEHLAQRVISAHSAFDAPLFF